MGPAGGHEGQHHSLACPLEAVPPDPPGDITAVGHFAVRGRRLRRGRASSRLPAGQTAWQPRLRWPSHAVSPHRVVTADFGAGGFTVSPPCRLPPPEGLGPWVLTLQELVRFGPRGRWTGCIQFASAAAARVDSGPRPCTPPSPKGHALLPSEGTKRQVLCGRSGFSPDVAAETQLPTGTSRYPILAPAVPSRTLAGAWDAGVGHLRPAGRGLPVQCPRPASTPKPPSSH